MMVSEFVALVSRMLKMDSGAIIILVMTSIILGAISHRIVLSIESGLLLTLGNLLLLMVWLSVWSQGSSLGGILLTVCLVVTGHRLYLWVLGYR